MALVVAAASLGFAQATYWSDYRNWHCYPGHGGTPLDVEDVAIKNLNRPECQDMCDNTAGCVGFTRSLDPNVHNPLGDCYLLTDVELDKCEVVNTRSWETYLQVEAPPLKGNVVYHLFEPKYTGLANKDAGDFKGDSGFIFATFGVWGPGNPEASMEHNIIEMSEVNVTGWGWYEACNAPGALGAFACPANQTEYCCGGPNHTRTQLPGLRVSAFTLGQQFGFEGWWFSFPKESQDVTWSERLIRRISGKCLGDAWRKDAGGCSACGDHLDSCVANCIKASLCVDGSVAVLEAIWDRVFADPEECPDVPATQMLV